MKEIIDVESKLIDEKPLPEVEMFDTADPNIKIKRIYVDEVINVKANNDEIIGRTLNLSQNMETVRKLEAMEIEDYDVKVLVEQRVAYLKDCIRFDEDFLSKQ
jgi:hypothetical protein